ncbi:MAG: BrnT family toxin [Burkholderiaceae bacterium]|nr:BrnT family toxin [Burkholderiaceae bacterium]
MLDLIYRIYNYFVEMRLIWDECKRQANLRKHGLDFADAVEVLGSRFRLDIADPRGSESRVLSISYALGFLAVLSVVHTERDGAARVISFRRASRDEREVYDDWLENECDEP